MRVLHNGYGNRIIYKNLKEETNMNEVKMMEKAMKKGVRRIINTMTYPANMNAVQSFLCGYSDEVKGIELNTSLAHKTEERSIDVTFLNGDLLTVTGEKREEGNVRYLINLDTKTNKTFYGTKEGTSPWVME